MKRYCMVNVIKKEYLDAYIEAHLNPWKELLECLKDAGTHEELIYMYNNLAIILIECEDIDIYMERFARSETGEKWLKKMSVFLEHTEFADDTGKAKASPMSLRKVFDLNEQFSTMEGGKR